LIYYDFKKLQKKTAVELTEINHIAIVGYLKYLSNDFSNEKTTTTARMLMKNNWFNFK